MKGEACKENNSDTKACLSMAKSFCGSYRKQEKQHQASELSPMPHTLPLRMLGQEGQWFGQRPQRDQNSIF